MSNSQATSKKEDRPLEGLIVIDLTRALAGPYATLLLAGLGAKVMRRMIVISSLNAVALTRAGYNVSMPV